MKPRSKDDWIVMLDAIDAMLNYLRRASLEEIAAFTVALPKDAGKCETQAATRGDGRPAEPLNPVDYCLALGKWLDTPHAKGGVWLDHVPDEMPLMDFLPEDFVPDCQPAPQPETKCKTCGWFIGTHAPHCYDNPDGAIKPQPADVGIKPRTLIEKLNGYVQVSYPGYAEALQEIEAALNAHQPEGVTVPIRDLQRWLSWFSIQAVAHSGELSTKAKSICESMRTALSGGK